MQMDLIQSTDGLKKNKRQNKREFDISAWLYSNKDIGLNLLLASG